MSFERNADIDTQLVPVRAETLSISDGNIPPKIRRIDAVLTAQGKRITTDIPSVWARFIAEAINKYWEDTRNTADKQGRILAKLIVGGDPRQKEDSREVAVDDNGRYRIKRVGFYSAWINQGCRELKKNTLYKWQKFPIDKPCTVTCTFYVKPKKRAIPLGDLIASALDFLRESSVLSEVTGSIVKSVDGSRIRVDAAYPRTEILIKEFVEE